MSYPDVSSIGEGSDYHRQQQPLAHVHTDVGLRQVTVHDLSSYSKSAKRTHSARAYEDVNSYWHNRAPAPHRATTIAATQPTPPPNSLVPSFYNGWDGSTQLGYRYSETRPVYTTGNGANDEYSQETGEPSLDTTYNAGYDSGYGAGRHIDNRRGYQGRQRSSLSPPRYAGPAFAYGPYHGGHIANGDHRYRHRSSVSPATPTMASTSASAYTPAPVSQHPESQNVEGAAYQQYHPYPPPHADMYGGSYEAGYTNDYSVTQLGATSWVKTLEKANLQPRLTFPDRGDPNLKKVKRLIKRLTVYPRVIEEREETTEMPSQAKGDPSSVSKASVTRTEITQDRNRSDAVATAGTASTSKAKGTASSSEQSGKRKAAADNNEARNKSNPSRDDKVTVGTKGSATGRTSKARKVTSVTTISEKKAGKRRAVEDTWAGSEPPRPLSPLDKTRRRYRKPAQPSASSSATAYSRTTAMRINQDMVFARDGPSAGGAEGAELN
ncbi:hypothetical protein EYR40_009129 [Pleurotus pulmonarius]|nr:hypothetical protein EYR40_009129 [Pleurotus pulmonarius]